MNEFIYVLTNAAMPGLLKIGWTSRDPQERANELSSSTSIPTPFIVELAIRVTSGYESERRIFDALRDHRHTGNREFFRIEVQHAAKRVLELIAPHEIYIDRIGAERRRLEERERQRTAAALKSAQVAADNVRRLKGELEAFHRQAVECRNLKAAQDAHLNERRRRLNEAKQELTRLGVPPGLPKASFLDELTGRAAKEQALVRSGRAKWEDLAKLISTLESEISAISTKISEINRSQSALAASISDLEHQLRILGERADRPAALNNSGINLKKNSPTSPSATPKKANHLLRYCIFCASHRETHARRASEVVCLTCNNVI
ncbi:MAG: hypothetical protein RI988_2445 [Pseudomonadota bacterium]|jgi:DNA repair exonuclease SbcCD ATPase subunit